jgi:hypothetical protein
VDVIESIKELNNPQFGSFGEYIFEHQLADQKLQRKHSESTDFILNGKSIDVKSARLFNEYRTVSKNYHGKRISGIYYAFVQFYSNIVFCSLEEKIIFTIDYKEIKILFCEWQKKRKRVKTKNAKISYEFKANLINIKKFIIEHFIALGYKPRIIYRTNQNEFGKESPGNLVQKTKSNNSVTIFISFNNYEIAENNIDKIIAFRDSESDAFPMLRNPKLHIIKIDIERLDAKYKYSTVIELIENFNSV